MIRLFAICIALGACTTTPSAPVPVIAPVIVEQARTFCQIDTSAGSLVVELVTDEVACAAIGGMPTDKPSSFMPKIGKSQ